MYRAIAVDIDGTITDMRSRVYPEAIDALREVQRRGLHVILATGNVLPIALGLAHFIGLEGPIVAENGGVVLLGEEMIHVNRNGNPLRAYEHLSSKMDVQRLFTDAWRETEVALRRTVDPDTVRDAVADFDVRVETTGFAIHIMEPTHSKFNGLLRALDLIDIHPDEVVAFGDSDNDVEMLRHCGLGVAVANASEPARLASDIVTEACHAHGVIEGLVHAGIL